MRKSHLKYLIIFSFLTIFFYQSINVRTYNHYTEGYILVWFCISILFYKILEKYFTMTLTRINTLEDGIDLEYDIISSKDGKRVSHIYVRTRKSVVGVWRELDYSYTIMNHCNLGKAQLFTKKHSTSTELKKWMNKKAITEKNINLAQYNDEEYMLTIGTFILVSIIFCILHFVVTNFNVIW